MRARLGPRGRGGGADRRRRRARDPRGLEPPEGRDRDEARAQHALDRRDDPQRPDEGRPHDRPPTHEREAPCPRDPDGPRRAGSRRGRGPREARGERLERASRDRLAMKRLIVNADDFGRAPGVNAGVLRAHRDGIVTATTLMVGAPAADDAARIARATPSLDVGVHLTITYGRPISDPSAVRSLVDHDGAFPRTPGAFVGTQRADRAEALVEYRAQVARARELI